MNRIAISTSVRCGSPLEKALADIAAAGFRDIDLLTIDGWVHVHPGDLVKDYEGTLRRLDGLLNEHGLRPIFLNTGTGPKLHQRSTEAGETRGAQVEGLVRLAGEYGVTVAAIQPLSGDPDRPEAEVFADCVETVREQVALGEEGGLRFALELHVHSPFETMEQARRLLDVYPDVPLVYDPTHFVMQGLDIRETGWLMDRARHAHLRDAAKGAIQAPFGQGQVDFDWVFGALKDRGYTGGFSIEYLESNDFDAMESALRLRDALQKAFA